MSEVSAKFDALKAAINEDPHAQARIDDFLKDLDASPFLTFTEREIAVTNEIIAIGKERGIELTYADLRFHANDSSELRDSDLEFVTGGAGVECFLEKLFSHFKFANAMSLRCC